ncbi:hypothetical protein EUGRSUZ_F00057 [Eucalyptus grandis]|uniref:Uncharacterized protein n=2 Tax=Eucalyptus grandis TaxID=71139 RepID=A0ACC3K9X9_EUCGR|nr:hypothetical protein EUGRSUZ_F00057 [Eucalyptus grandis]
MKCLLLYTWTWALAVLMGSRRSMGCLEEERIALLNIEAAFYPPNGSSFLSRRHNSLGDCCHWAYVECDNTTLRVTRLYLSGTHGWKLGEFGWEREESRPWVIDASLFLPLEELQVLDLSGNSLLGNSLSLPPLPLPPSSYFNRLLFEHGKNVILWCYKL